MAADDGKVKVEVIPLSALTPDPRNANLGTERGHHQLVASLEELGAARSIVADRHGVVPAGNKALEAAVEAGFEEAVVVETDGRRLVVVRRADWDLLGEDVNNPARQYAYRDNVIALHDIALDAERVAADLRAGLDLSAVLREDEIAKLLAELPENVEFPEYDEGVADGVEWLECPECGHRWPK